MPLRARTRYWAIETTEDEDVRTYHSRLQLLEGYSAQGLARGTNPASIEFQPSPILDIILQIPGVTVAHLTPYSISVRKSPMYQWEEVESEVMRLLHGVQTAKDDSEWKLDIMSQPRCLVCQGTRWEHSDDQWAACQVKLYNVRAALDGDPRISEK